VRRKVWTRFYGGEPPVVDVALRLINGGELLIALFPLANMIPYIEPTSEAAYFCEVVGAGVVAVPPARAWGGHTTPLGQELGD